MFRTTTAPGRLLIISGVALLIVGGVTACADDPEDCSVAAELGDTTLAAPVGLAAVPEATGGTGSGGSGRRGAPARRGPRSGSTSGGSSTTHLDIDLDVDDGEDCDDD